MSRPTVIHWFRRDLRLQDNLALHAAFRSGARVLPVFVLDPSILRSRQSDSTRMAFLLRSLDALDESLRALGSRLVVRYGDPLPVLIQLVREMGVSALYVNRDYSPYATRRDARLLREMPVPIHAFDDEVLIPPADILKPDLSPYTVYTPYKNVWRKLPKPPVSLIELTPDLFVDAARAPAGDIPTLADLGFSPAIALPQTGEAYAVNRLHEFAAADIYTYAESRNNLIVHPFAEAREKGPSYLSPYFRFGLLSPRQAYWTARTAYEAAPDEAARQSVTAWVDELIWREFYVQILAHFPHVQEGSFKREYDQLEWRTSPDELAAWKEGMTGYPVVDAAMRQLRQVGWLPNRARMIVASFLSKDLLIHWREGEAHFMQHLLDGDPAQNNGGWQWSAGTGTDAQPYFRIFNPSAQSQKFDPEGIYLRHWLPELRDVPLEHVHTPWTLGTKISGYPTPIVDHGEARDRTLAAFKSVKP